jgi:hypothetical protein
VCGSQRATAPPPPQRQPNHALGVDRQAVGEPERVGHFDGDAAVAQGAGRVRSRRRRSGGWAYPRNTYGCCLRSSPARWRATPRAGASARSRRGKKVERRRAVRAGQRRGAGDEATGGVAFAVVEPQGGRIVAGWGAEMGEQSGRRVELRDPILNRHQQIGPARRRDCTHGRGELNGLVSPGHRVKFADRLTDDVDPAQSLGGRIPAGTFPERGFDAKGDSGWRVQGGRKADDADEKRRRRARGCNWSRAR